ncbi:phage integrase SAM-like domain-containing protein [Chitinophaga pollutisoli]|uniref:Phage integrase SAM-like domain-containing protein n=1 Tax=Chitinophaga pollutisoli TaxID=3133966 RepID=A0ABZ2YME2_9BACT
MNFPTFNVVFNYRNANNKNGKYSIHIRITFNQNSKYFEVKVPKKVGKHQWSGKYGRWVKNNHEFSNEINEKIDCTLRKLIDLQKRYFSNCKQLTFTDIFRELRGEYSGDNFNVYFSKVIKDPPELLVAGTLKRYEAALLVLQKFNSNLDFHELTTELFMRLKKFAREKLSLSASTIRGYFNVYKKVVYWARLQGQINREHERQLFIGVKHKMIKPKKEYLEVHEIIAWKKYEFLSNEVVYERDRDMFLLLIYSGLYYSDLKKLRKEDLREDHQFGYYLYTKRRKNDNFSIIPLWKFPHAIEILNSYKETDKKVPFLLKREFLKEDQVFNRNLKVISGPKMLDWNRKVINKMGRFTNSQL